MVKRILCLFAERGRMMAAKSEKIAELEKKGTMINWSDDHVKAKASVNSEDEIVFEYKTILVVISAGPLEDYAEVHADDFVDDLHKKIEIIDNWGKKEEPAPVESTKPAEKAETSPEAQNEAVSEDKVEVDKEPVEEPKTEEKPAKISQEEDK